MCVCWGALLWVWSLHPSCAGWAWLPPGSCPDCSRPSGTQTHRGPASPHTVTHTNMFEHTMMHKNEQTDKTVCNLHERPWHYWRNTKNSHTGRSTVAWMPVTHRHKQTCKIIRSAVVTTELFFFSHLCNGYFLFLSLPHILSQEMDREWATAAVNLCPWISAILHLSQAHITRLYSIKMSLMREEVPRRVGWGCILFFVTSHIQIKTTREIIIDGYVSFLFFYRCNFAFEILEKHFRDLTVRTILSK